METWSKARDTFGQGVPPTGERFDSSSQFRSLQSTVATAAPASRWSGAAASAYDKANTDHGKVFGGLATLDQQLGAKVTESANIVQTGRQNLDAVKQWVTDAAAAVPAGKNREQLLLPIVKQGLGQLQEVVAGSNGKLNDVAKDIKKLDGEYKALDNQKYGGANKASSTKDDDKKKAPGAKDVDDKKPPGPTNDDKKPHPKNVELDDKKKAPAPKDPESAEKSPKKKYGTEKSIGKGSDSHVEVSGDPEKEWGHPAGTHEVWRDNPGRAGKFDGDHGSWDWQGVGTKGEAYASEHTDGKTGKADVDAWVVKGEASYQRDVFGNPLSANADGEVGAHASADGALTDHGVSGQADAFIGAEAGGKVDYKLGPIDLSLGATAQAGAGANAGIDFGMQDGKFVFGASLGAALGLGGKVSPHIAIDPKGLMDGVHKAEHWVSGLFG